MRPVVATVSGTRWIRKAQGRDTCEQPCADFAEEGSNDTVATATVPRYRLQVASLVSLKPFYLSDTVALYCGEAHTVLSHVATASVDCIITSPPYYGQRDYGSPAQLGLEPHPQLYIDRLVTTLDECWRLLKAGGSLWVNIGDTYWSGKGAPTRPDRKQKSRRFDRPQDQVGPRPWCTPKQLLLIPHRFAIAMQGRGWIVRNDNVWHKPAPTPDPVADRCSSAHEYVFHFVKQRRYYFNADAVAVPSNGERDTKPPQSVWTVSTKPSQKQHTAVFPEELVWLPILATCPSRGVVLDPFCGSGTTLAAASFLGGQRRGIGVDISEGALREAATLLSPKPSSE